MSTFEWTGNETLVVGPWVDSEWINASYSWSAGSCICGNVPVDPLDGPFSYVAIAINFNGQQTNVYFSDQWEAHAGRLDRINSTFWLSAGSPYIYGSGDSEGWGPNFVYQPLQLFISLPDGFSLVNPNVTAVPEASTWVLLLLGFIIVAWRTKWKSYFRTPT